MLSVTNPNTRAFISTGDYMGQTNIELRANGKIIGYATPLISLPFIVSQLSQQMVMLETGEVNKFKGLKMLFSKWGQTLNCRNSYDIFLKCQVFWHIFKVVSAETTSKKEAIAAVQNFGSLQSKIEAAFLELKISAKVANFKPALQCDTYYVKAELGSVSALLDGKNQVELASFLAQGDIFVYSNTATGLVEIQVPKQKREFVAFKSETIDTNCKLPLYIGTDTVGEAVTIDLAATTNPHLLVAGSSGSGKSKGLITMLQSLIAAKSADTVQILVCDPKISELQTLNKHSEYLFSGEVQTESIGILDQLLEVSAIMQDRYQTLSRKGVYEISDYHAAGLSMPYLVVAIDEFGDLMLSKQGKEIETEILRLSQKGRAAGIHLIIATQRPDAKIVTGAIKGNFTAQLCFKVKNGTNSRIVLDQNGAENLLGKGDCLLQIENVVSRIQAAMFEPQKFEQATTLF